MTPEALLDSVRQISEKESMAAFGIADISALRTEWSEDVAFVPAQLTRAVVLGVRLLDTVLDRIEDSPTLLYMHNYRQANYQLDRVAMILAGYLQEGGYQALPVPASQIVQRQPIMLGHVSHKLFGWAAGLGWRGRNSLLVSPKHGCRMRYVTILTDAPLPAGEPIADDCGECCRCISVCPAQAIRERAEDFGLAACAEKLTEFCSIPGVGQHICGVCVKACRGQ